MVNWSQLNNLTPPSFNTTDLTNMEEIVPIMLTAVDDTTQGYFGLGVMSVMFLVMTFAMFREDGDIRLDILRTLMISSGFTSIIGLILLVIGVSTSFVHLMWFMSLFILTSLMLYITKKRGF